MSVAHEQTVVGLLSGIVDEQYVLTDDYSVSLYAQDVYTKDLPAMAVVQPDNTEELADVVRAVTKAGLIHGLNHTCHTLC